MTMEEAKKAAEIGGDQRGYHGQLKYPDGSWQEAIEFYEWAIQNGIKMTDEDWSNYGFALDVRDNRPEAPFIAGLEAAEGWHRGSDKKRMKKAQQYAKENNILSPFERKRKLADEAEAKRKADEANKNKKPKVQPNSAYNNDLVTRIMNGEFGTGEERRQALIDAGYDPDKAQALVNQAAINEQNEKNNEVDITTKDADGLATKSGVQKEIEVLLDKDYDEQKKILEDRLSSLGEKQRNKYAESIPMFLLQARNEGVLGTSFDEATGREKPLKPDRKNFESDRDFNEAMKDYREELADYREDRRKFYKGEYYLEKPKAPDFDAPEPVEPKLEDFQKKYDVKPPQKPEPPKPETRYTVEEDKEGNPVYKKFNSKGEEIGKGLTQTVLENSFKLQEKRNKRAEDRYQKEMAKYEEAMKDWNENKDKGEEELKAKAQEEFDQAHKQYEEEHYKWQYTQENKEEVQKKYEEELANWEKESKRLSEEGAKTGKRYSRLALDQFGTFLENWGSRRSGVAPSKESMWMKDRAKYYEEGQNRMNAQNESERAALQTQLDKVTSDKNTYLNKMANTAFEAWNSGQMTKAQYAIVMQGAKELQQAINNGDYNILKNSLPAQMLVEQVTGQKLTDTKFKEKDQEINFWKTRLDEARTNADIANLAQQTEAQRIKNKYGDEREIADLAHSAAQTAHETAQIVTDAIG